MKKRILSLLLAVSVLMGGTTFAAAEFSDVNETDYFYPAVQWGAESGITYGVDEEHFAPEGEVTRAQVVTFLWRMAGQPEPTVSETFKDVETGSWYETAVKWAVENEITAGTGDNMFSPDVTCDRAMCITLLYRLMDCPFDGIDLTADVELDENSTMEDLGFAFIKEMVNAIREQGMLADVPEDSYFEMPVYWAVFNNIITDDNTLVSKEEGIINFCPENPCVRKEMISFLYQTKMLNDMANAPAEVYFDEYSVPVPQEYFERLYYGYYGVEDEETGEELLLVVSEGASVDAAEAMGEEDTEGVGELFRIVKVNEERLNELLSGDMSGIQAFAKDEEGKYYLFCTPTDVRYVRESNEKMDEDIEEWSELNDWVHSELIDNILDANSTLTPVNFTDTVSDSPSEE